jgi:hypothetical protein
MLEEVIGRIEGSDRWQHFLDSNCRTAREFHQSWGSIRLEVASCFNFLGREMDGPMMARVGSAGGESTDGSTRRAVTQQREHLRHCAITEALTHHPDRLARPVTAFQNFDKLSGAWILALPTSSTGLTGRVFTEAMASHLCIPSPAVRTWVGHPVGKDKIRMDPFGDAVMNCKDIPGDSWRIRHDSGKLAIVNQCLLSKLPVECEVYGIFADLIPSGASIDGEFLQWGRARQALVPDYRLRIPHPMAPLTP